MVGVHLPPPRVGAGLAPSPKPLQRGGSGRLPSHDPPLSPLPPLPPTPPHPLYQRCCPFKSAAGPPGGGRGLSGDVTAPIDKTGGIPGAPAPSVGGGGGATCAGPPVAEEPQQHREPGQEPGTGIGTGAAAMAMEHAGLFPPFPAATAACLPAQPAPSPPPPPPNRAAETSRLITDPLSGRSYCKGRLLGKVPGDNGGVAAG